MSNRKTPENSSYFGRGQATRGSQDRGSVEWETLPIPQHLVGSVIGRQGANIRRITETSGARIHIDSDNLAVIKGSQTQRDHARSLINETLKKQLSNGETGSEIEFIGDSVDSETMSLPEHSVGGVIGRKGERINDIKSRSGAQIRIENNSAIITGSLVQRNEAKALITEILEHLFSDEHQNQETGSEIEFLGDGTDSDIMLLPEHLARGLIGPNKEWIKNIRSSSGARIKIESNLAIITGSRVQRNSAKTLITEILEESDDTDNESILIPENFVGRLIGRSGENIKNMESTSGALIQVRDNKAIIMGSWAQRDKAKTLIYEILGVQTSSEGDCGKEKLNTPQHLYSRIRGAIQQIMATSGARVLISLDSATIFGTQSQRTTARKLINEIKNESLEKKFHERQLTQLFPDLGFTLLDLGNLKTREGTLHFHHYTELDANRPSRKQNYRLEFVPKKGELSDKDKDIDDLTSALGRMSTNYSTVPKTHFFETTEKLPYCLDEINSNLWVIDPSLTESRKIRVNLFFGLELFGNIPLEMSLDEWCLTRRASKVYTSFQHHAPRVLEKIESIQKKYGFKPKNESDMSTAKKPGCSIYYYQPGYDKRKLKLHWYADEGKWKISKAIKAVQRVAILDIVSGSNAPDLRLLLKNHYKDSIEEEFVKLIEDMQVRILIPQGRMWFNQSDFTPTESFKCEGIRRVLEKKRYVNDKYQITFVTTLLDSEKGELVRSEGINLKHSLWKEIKDHSNLPLNKSLLEESIRETIELARELVRHVGASD